MQERQSVDDECRSPPSRINPGNDLDKSRIDELRAAGLLPGQLATAEETVAIRARMQAVKALDPRRVDNTGAAATMWTAERVGERLIEACSVIARTAMRTRPRGYAGCWPAFKGMTQAEINEAQSSGELARLYADMNRVRIPPSSREIELAEEAIVWPMRYLDDDPDGAGIVMAWASETWIPGEEPPVPVRIALRTIAGRLRRALVPVR